MDRSFFKATHDQMPIFECIMWTWSLVLVIQYFTGLVDLEFAQRNLRTSTGLNSCNVAIKS